MTDGFKFTPKKSGLAAALDQAQKQEGLIKKESKALSQEIKYSKPEDCSERIRIIFDDSGSMAGPKITDAIEGCVEFMRNCVLNQTAVSIHPMNKVADQQLEPLTTNLPALSVAVKALVGPEGDILVSGSTPLFETFDRAQKMNPKASRYVIFSDGQPNNTEKKEQCLTQAIEEKTPVDTVFICIGDSDYGATLLKEIADRTGGYFLKFDRNKVNFKSAFKYLAPTLRLQLHDGNVRKALEEGRLK